MRCTIATFAELGVPGPICDALASHGITEAFPIQELTLGLALSGKDLIGQAKTGTGKTLGFGLPLLSRVVSPQSDEWSDFAKAGKPQALVIVPTRELAIQVADDLDRAGTNLGIRVVSFYGGKAYEPQIEALQAGVEVVVGTPGRLIDLMKQRHLDLGSVKILVLDEADEMLDMGFLPDVETLVASLPTTRQTMLFSATMPGQIISLARRYMSNPTHIRATDPTSESSIVDSIEQHVWRAHNMDKPELVARVLQAQDRGRTIVFCRTKRAASNLADELSQRGFSCGAIHGDLGQGAREKALADFRAGTSDVLIATDVAARGIDINDVTHVINYECPEDDKTYVHRIGRTGRAGNSGVAVTLVDWQDLARWQMINKTLGLPFHEPLETYSSSDHVFTGLNIPREVKGSVGEPKKSPVKPRTDAKKSSGGKPQGGRSHSKSNGKPRETRSDAKPAEKVERAPRQPRERTRTRRSASDQ